MNPGVSTFLGALGAFAFVILAAFAPNPHRATPTCDLEFRFYNGALEWRCNIEDEDCDQCGVAGTCRRDPPGVPPFPGSVSCICKSDAGEASDTCNALVALEISGTYVECFNGPQHCDSADFCFGAPLPCCDKSAIGASWVVACNCIRGKEDADN